MSARKNPSPSASPAPASAARRLRAADQPSRLDETELARGARVLARRDPVLRRILKAQGVPPLWHRSPGFSTLVQIILEQQVSLASGKATFDRLRRAAKPLTPRRLLALSDEELLAAGLSRQKRRYCRDLAEHITSRKLKLRTLDRLTDEEVHAQLTQVKGLGRWSADIYLLMVLRRPDAWPAGDLALATAAKEVLGLRAVPDLKKMDELAEGWRPWRAVAARLIWSHYLNTPRKK